MHVLISFIMTNTSQCIHISNNQIVFFKRIHFICHLYFNKFRKNINFHLIVPSMGTATCKITVLPTLPMGNGAYSG